MPRVLGVHGIGQQYRSGPELTRGWWDALRGGLEAAGLRTTAESLAEADVRVAFFGDLFRPKGSMAGGRAAVHARRPAARPGTGPAPGLVPGGGGPGPDGGSPGGALGPGRVAAQVMVERLLRSPAFAWVAQRGFIGNLKQVTAFLTKPEVKERVLQRVDEEMTPDTRVLVGHSLGSIVVYEFLARDHPPQVELLVTLGSPLGIPNLLFERLTPAPTGGVGAWPGGVAGWVNLADPDDKVALCKQLAPLFPARNGGAGVEDRLVDNGEEPHAASRYLNAEPTGAALGRVL